MFFAWLINAVIILVVLWVLGNKFLVKKEPKLNLTKTKENVINKQEKLKIVKTEREDLSEEIEVTDQINQEEKKKEMEKIAKEEAIIKGEKMRDIAKLDAAAAEQEKIANIRRGEGEASRKKMVMEADGALEIKVGAWVEAQRYYALAIGKQKWVSEINMGAATNGSESNAALDMIKLFGVKTAKDLALDMNMNVTKK